MIRPDISLVGELPGTWLERVLNPSLIFWGLGGLALGWRYGFADLQRAFLALPGEAQIGLALAGLLALMVSDQVARRFQIVLLRLLEGYWPGVWPLTWLRARLIRRQQARYAKLEERWAALQLRWQEGKALSPQERQELGFLELRLRRYPGEDPDAFLPTRLGTFLRTAEIRPWHRYGLDGVTCWPALWSVLPEAMQATVAQARESLDVAVRVVLWGLLSLVWMVWTPWVGILGLAAAWIGYGMAVAAAEVYALWVETAFHVYRFALYRALEWPLPQDEAQVRRTGEAITRYLAGG